MLRSSISKRLFVISVFFLLLIYVSSSWAALKIESVYPTLGVLGQPLPINIQGSGFDSSTRVSLALDSGNRRAGIGRIDTPSYARDIEISGSVAYVADGKSGLQVIDISNPENPQIIATEDTPGNANALAISGTNAFIADGPGGLQVIDISNPSNPQRVGSGIATPEETWGLAIDGNRAYVAYGPEEKDLSPDILGGLLVVDISSPASLQIIATRDMGFKGRGVAVMNPYVYVTGMPSGRDISNDKGRLVVMDTGSFGVVGSVLLPDYYARDVTVSGSFAYVSAWRTHGVQVVNVSNPASPVIVHGVPTGGRAVSVTIAGDTGYVADDYGGVSIMDVSDPAASQITGIIDTEGMAERIVLRDDYAYVAAGEEGLQIVDITVPAFQQVISWVPTPGISQFFEIKGNHVFLGDGGAGMQVIDISDPEEPSIVGNIETVHSARHVDVVGNIAYIADSLGGLQVANISDPEHPSIIGSYIPPPPNATRHVTISEAQDIAFLAHGTRAILVDVSTPSNPAPIKEVTGFGMVDGIIAINGNYAYIPDKVDGDIKVVDFSVPAAAAIIKTIDVPGDDDEGPRCITLDGNKAYVANGDHGLCVLDISNPANPVFNSAWSIELFERAYYVTLNEAGDVAYVADGYSGIQMVDVSDPANMYVLGSLDTAGNANCVSVDGDKAFVGDFSNGFIVVPLPVEIKPVTVSPPSGISCTLPSPSLPGHYILRVFNSSGDIFDLDGAVTFSETVNKSRAIIVTGGNYCISQEQKLEDEFQIVADEAYRAFLFQGFKKDDIMFLGPDMGVDIDGRDGPDDVDDINFKQNIEYAFTTWAVNEAPHDIFVYMVGHGTTGYYKPNCDNNDRIFADDVKEWINGLMGVATGNVVLIYDACDSGAFLLNMDESVGKSPIVITSCKINQDSWFVEDEDEEDDLVSFSSGFWNSVSSREGARLDKAFNDGKDMVKVFLQTPLMDTNGDRQPNTPEDITDIVIFGRGYQPDNQVPEIAGVSGNLSLNGETSAIIWASGITTATGSLTEVFALITPPCFNPDLSIPGTGADLDKVVLSDGNADGVYQGSYGNFSVPGTYKIAIYARDSEGNESVAKEMYVYQSSGRDEFEFDDTYEQATDVILNGSNSQCHNFFDPGDEDWVRFLGVSGQWYVIEASDLDPNNDVVIEVYDTDGTTKIDEENDSDNPRANEDLFWHCTADGFYYAKIRPANTGISGEQTDYRLEIYHPVADIYGYIAGTIKNKEGAPIEDASVKTNVGASGISKDGSYFMVHKKGPSFLLTTHANGYQEKNIADIPVDEDQTTIVNVELQPMDSDILTATIQSPAADVSISTGADVNFQGSVTGGKSPFTYTWDFNGGATNVAVEDPGDVRFSIPGTFTVTFMVEDADSDSDSATVRVIVSEEDPGNGGGGGGGCLIETILH